MANVAHATLSGADLHEPKGIAAASANTVYVADGVGSGAWSSGSTLVGITGQIADFGTPIAPTGWLECDGTTVSRSTFSALFTSLTIQQTGSRTNGSAIVTGLSSTTHMRAGYFVGGTGITNGFTILSVDSSTQITMSGNAGSTGSSTVIVSPFALGDGSTTFTLPDVTTTVGRFRRSRSVGTKIGTAQTDAVLTHTHTIPAATYSTGGQSAAHTHTQGGSFTSGGQSVDHTHSIATSLGGSPYLATGGNFAQSATVQTGGASVDHTHTTTIGGETGNNSADHSHTIPAMTTTTSSLAAGSETRPYNLIVLTCIKT